MPQCSRDLRRIVTEVCEQSAWLEIQRCCLFRNARASARQDPSNVANKRVAANGGGFREALFPVVSAGSSMFLSNKCTFVCSTNSVCTCARTPPSVSELSRASSALAWALHQAASCELHQLSFALAFF